MKLSDKIKIAALAYWRFEKHHMMGAIECKNSDVFTVSRTLFTTDTEVKVSISDMQREIDTKRYKHENFKNNIPDVWRKPSTHYFYFAVPLEMQDKALSIINERYSYAGLLVFIDGEIDVYNPHNIIMVKHSYRFNHGKVDIKELLQIGYQTTNTTLRFAQKILNSELLDLRHTTLIKGAYGYRI
jgi:hypothetical protein